VWLTESESANASSPAAARTSEECQSIDIVWCVPSLMTVMTDPRAANAQRGYIMFFVFFFLLLTANDFTPAKTRRNQRASGGHDGQGKGELGARGATRSEEVRDKVIIDLSESNAALEVENRRLRASVIGLRSALKKHDGGAAEARAFDEAYNLTSLSLGENDREGGVLQLKGRNAHANAGVAKEDAENEIPGELVGASRRTLRNVRRSLADGASA